MKFSDTMEKKRKKEELEDDGRTIANMNVEGMPWYHRPSIDAKADSNRPSEPMTPEEQRLYTWAAIKAGLLIVLVFAVVFGLFIAFCDFVWFR